MDKHLSSNILSTGNKFTVTDKIPDNTFGNGTTGIVSYVKGIDTECTNVVHLQTVILKRGKQGKPRLDVELISIPIFSFDNMNSSTIMPDKKRKYYVDTEPCPFSLYSIYEMSDLDYLGWALSWTMYLNQLSRYTKPFNIWPMKQKNIMNKMLGASDYWKEDSVYLSDTYGSAHKREIFIKQMRIMELTLTACSLSYMLKIAKIEIDAIKYLINHNCNKIKIENKNKLSATYEFFMKKYTNLKLIEKKNTISPKKELIFPF
jgi:hypothetical protein